MKGLLVLLVLVGGGVLALKFVGSSVTEGFNPAEQGREARANVEGCSSWTEVLDRLSEPSRWRDGTSDFDKTARSQMDDRRTGELHRFRLMPRMDRHVSLRKTMTAIAIKVDPARAVEWLRP